MRDDSTLLGRYVQGGDEAAFAEVVRRHVDLVYGAAMRKLNGNRARAEDVTQEVFVALARKAPGLVGHPTLVGWLYVSAHHAAARLMRAEERRESREKEVAMRQRDDEVASIDWNRIRPALDEALQQLKPEERDAVLLRFFEQRPFKEVGAALRLTEDAARMRTDRAIEKLRAFLFRRGIESTGGALALALTEGAHAAPVGLATSVAHHAVAAGKTTSVVALMASGKALTAAAVVLAVIASAGCGVELMRQRRLKGDLQAITAERTRVLAHIRDVHRGVPAAKRPVQAKPNSLVTDSINAPPPGAAIQMELLKPGLAATWQRSLDGRTLQRDAELLPKLGLSPEELERYVRLRNAGVMAMSGGTFHGERYIFVATGSPAGVDPQAELAKLLGPQRQALLDEYDRTESARNFAEAAAGQAMLAGAPLASDQVLKLREVAGAGIDGISDRSGDSLADAQRVSLRATELTEKFEAQLESALAEQRNAERKPAS